jgi:hypothetical protein
VPKPKPKPKPLLPPAPPADGPTPRDEQADGTGWLTAVRRGAAVAQPPPPNGEPPPDSGFQAAVAKWQRLSDAHSEASAAAEAALANRTAAVGAADKKAAGTLVARHMRKAQELHALCKAELAELRRRFSDRRAQLDALLQRQRLAKTRSSVLGNERAPSPPQRRRDQPAPAAPSLVPLDSDERRALHKLLQRLGVVPPQPEMTTGAAAPRR